MKALWIFCLLCLVMSCSGQTAGGDQSSCSCNSGREFVLLEQSQVQVVRTGPDSSIEIKILSNGEETTTTLELELGQAANLSISTNETCSPLKITSSSDISVLSTDSNGNVALIPSSNNDFIIVTPPGLTKDEASKINLTPLEAGTFQIFAESPLTVNGVTFRAGDDINLNINPFTGLAIESQIGLEGVRIIGNGAVAVLAPRPCGASDCSAVFERIVPRRCFGPSFFPPGTIFSPSPATAMVMPLSTTPVQYTSGDKTNTRIISPKNTLQFDASVPTSYRSAVDTMVMLIKKEDEATCRAVTLFPNNSERCRKFKTFSKDDCTLKLAITCRTEISSEIIIDGVHPAGIIWKKYPGTAYSLGTVSLSPGSHSHVIEHPTEAFRIQCTCSSEDKNFSTAAVCIEGTCSAASTGPGNP